MGIPGAFSLFLQAYSSDFQIKHIPATNQRFSEKKQPLFLTAFFLFLLNLHEWRFSKFKLKFIVKSLHCSLSNRQLRWRVQSLGLEAYILELFTIFQSVQNNCMGGMWVLNTNRLPWKKFSTFTNSVFNF